MARRLAVVLYGQVIAQLDQATPSADPLLTYEGSPRHPLSLSMPVSGRKHRGKALNAYLENLLPESAGTRERWAEQLGVTSDDPVGLLAQMGWDLPGAVQFADPDRLSELQARSGEHLLVSAGDIADRLRSLRTAEDPSWTLPNEHWSLAGQQSKIALARLDGDWYAAEGSAATTHIIKPGIGRLVSQALVEHATMAASRAVGVDVARTEWTYFVDEPAVIVERFDRLVEGRIVTRFHQEDFASASATLPRRKYEENGGPGLARMARIVREHSAARTEDLGKLMDFVAINYIAGAPDGHAKNISLLLYPDGTEVAPLYDIATSFPYFESPNQALRSVAVSIGGRRKYGQVLGKHWDRAAATLGLDPTRVRDRVRHLATEFPDAFHDALAATDHPSGKEVEGRAMIQLARHIDHLVARLDDPPDVTPSSSPRSARR